MDINRLRKYTPIDFLKDDDFLKWQLIHDKEDDSFWNNLINEHPYLKANIEEAVALYENSVRLNDYRLLSEEVSQSLASLQNSITKERRKKKRKLFVLQISAVAACIIVAVILTPFLKNKKEIVQNDMTAFVHNLPEVDFTVSDTKLILSDSTTIELSNKESSIRYDNEAIKADDNLILKEQTSVYNQLITPYGKRSILTFSDGTKAWVNAGSELVYPADFGEDKREIYVNGEIYIEVSEDPKRPFIIKTADMDIKVLGTKFNVSAYEADKEKNVVLLSGSVNVSSNKLNKGYVLIPNQKYSNYGDSYKIENVDADIYIAWTKGFYIFESENLKNILIRLERYYGVKIECDNSIANLKCSGKLDLKEDLNKLLIELTRALSTEYKHEEDGSYMIKVKS